MPKLLKLTIGKKLWLLTLSTALGITILTVVFLLSERQLLLSERQNNVRQAVEVAHGVLAHYQAQAAKGALPEADAKRAALDEIKTLRYSGSEYFWVNDMATKMVMHPAKPELDGKDMSDSADPTGRHPFIEFVGAVKANGAGFVFYMWPKPGSADPVQKVSYVKGFAPWGWVIGSGVYIDTVNATFWSRAAYFAAGTLGLAALLTGFGIVIARSISRPLIEAVKLAQTVAAGDLTTSIDAHGDDETGQLMRALNDMNHSLGAIVGRVHSGTDTIATASRQIAAGNLDLSSRTEQQASALEQTASAMEELTSTVQQNAENARQANALAASASSVAVKGGEVVAHVVETMESINASSKKIVDIIAVIDGIAFQTNILALNAAVEAARAGEQGRGFAVVATEVRNLAQRSAAAAREIKSLIGDSVDKVETGSVLVHQAGATMDEIVASVKRVTDIMAEITCASVEQESGIEQINKAIGEMDAVTQQNAALVEEAAAAAESLQDQAGGLAQVVSVFKVDDHHLTILKAAPRRAAQPAAPRIEADVLKRAA
ncbi:MAG: cache domain-containing protein [Burkholderiaceae bacterium]|nr:cache domain-containing protein [Burkholderiaceae bacterium]